MFQSDMSVDVLHTKDCFHTSDSGTTPQKSAISSAKKSPRSFCYFFRSILITYFLDYIFSIKIYIYTGSMKMIILICFQRQQSSLNIISFFSEIYS